MYKQLISISIIAIVMLDAVMANSCPTPCGAGSGGCNCECNCGGGGGGPPPTCPPCPPPTGMPPTHTPPHNMTGPPSQDSCFALIRASANLSAGQLIGLLLTTLLSNLVVPILQTVLAGNNTVEGAVIPLANVLCFIVGVLLLLLRSLGLLGVLGLGGLLQGILGGGGGGILG